VSRLKYALSLRCWLGVRRVVPAFFSLPRVQVFELSSDPPTSSTSNSIRLSKSVSRSINVSNEVKMCLFSSPKPRRRHAYIEETYIAPRPVSRSHHHHHGSHGRASYTSVTRTSRPVSREYIAPARVSQSSYRRSAPVVVEERRSTRSYRR
jgi:hypothetical protein